MLYIAWVFIKILFRKYRSTRNIIKIKVCPRAKNKVKILEAWFKTKLNFELSNFNNNFNFISKKCVSYMNVINLNKHKNKVESNMKLIL